MRQEECSVIGVALARTYAVLLRIRRRILVKSSEKVPQSRPGIIKMLGHVCFTLGRSETNVGSGQSHDGALTRGRLKRVPLSYIIICFAKKGRPCKSGSRRIDAAS